MNKMTKNIILAACALCIIGVGLFVALKWEPAPEKISEVSEITSNYIDVTNIDSDTVTSLKITNAHGSYTICAHTENDTTTYSIPEYPDIEFSQPMLSSAIYSFTGLSGKETSADISKKSEYGFDKPYAIAVITQNDGSEITVFIGNESTVDTGRYTITDKSDIICIIPSYTAETFEKVPDDYRNREIASIDTSSIKAVTINKAGNKVMKIREITKDDNLRTTSVSNLLIEYPYLRDVNADTVTTLLENFTSISAVNFPELSEKEYGFETGINIIIENTDITHNITFGKSDKDGNVYTKYNDLDYVITTTPAMFNALANLNPLDYTSKLIHIFSIEDVKNIAITANDKTTNLSIEHGEESDTYTINGAKIEDTAFKSFYQSVIGIALTGDCPTPRFDTPYATVIFEFTDGTTDTTTYYNYDDRNYCVKCSDGNVFLVLKKNFDTAIDKIEG